jgi:2-iminobutanoate/2-iminopropanoate deaminase
MSDRKIIEVPWPAGGHYSQGIQAGGLLFVAGQTAGAAGSPELTAMDVRAQTAACIERVRGVLAEAGGGLADVVKTTCFLSDIADFGAFNEAYAEAFGALTPPTRSTVEVGSFPEGLLVEVEAIAVVGS